jgi:hypothetical protein
MKMRGESQGGAGWRLVKKGVHGERGAMGRGKVGPEEITSRGFIYLFIYFSLTLATLRLWRILKN